MFSSTLIGLPFMGMKCQGMSVPPATPLAGRRKERRDSTSAGTDLCDSVILRKEQVKRQDIRDRSHPQKKNSGMRILFLCLTGDLLMGKTFQPSEPYFPHL